MPGVGAGGGLSGVTQPGAAEMGVLQCFCPPALSWVCEGTGAGIVSRRAAGQMGGRGMLATAGQIAASLPTALLSAPELPSYPF